MKKNTLLIGLLLVSGTLAAQDWPTKQKRVPAADGGGWETQSIFPI